jgi:hypothetical protein
MTNQTVSYPLQDAILRYLFELPRATHADSWARWKDAVREHTKNFKEERFDDVDLKLAITQLWKGHKVELTKTGGTEQYSGNEEDDARFFFQGIFKMAGTADGRGSWEHIEKVPRRGHSSGWQFPQD